MDMVEEITENKKNKPRNLMKHSFSICNKTKDKVNNGEGMDNDSFLDFQNKDLE